MGQHGTAMLSETVAPRVLPRILSRFDLVAIYFAMIFSAYGAGQMGSLGWSSIPMMIMACVIFLLPCAFAAYELGTLFTGEGGIYVWAHKTFGPVHGFISGWLSWVPILLILPLGETAVAAHIQESMHVEWPKWVVTVVQVALVWIEVFVCSRSLRFSQKFVRIGFFVSFATALIVFAVGLMQPGTATPYSADLFSWNVFKHGAVFSAAVLWLLGVEMPFTMGDEYSTHRKTAGTMLVWGTLTLMIGYLMGTAGALWSLPQEKIDATKGIAQAVSAHYPLLGSAVAVAIWFAVFSQEVAYMNGYSRLMFVSAIEKRLPAFFGHVDAKGVPLRALVAQGIGASVVIFIFSFQSSTAVVFNLYLAALVAVWCASLYYIYGAILRVRKQYADLYKSRGDDIWLIPGGQAGVWIVAVWGIIANTIAIYYVFALPWVTEGITTAGWQASLAAIVVAVAVAGVLLYRHSLKQRKA